MKVEIEDYRGWTIFFDTENERFYSVSQADDVDKENRSFAAARKAIDDYLKVNVDFKPFEVLYCGYGGREVPVRKVQITGRTKNGRFMAVDANKGKYQISNYDGGCYVFDNPANTPIYEEISRLDGLVEEMNHKIGKLRESLKIRTLKDYAKEITE